MAVIGKKLCLSALAAASFAAATMGTPVAVSAQDIVWNINIFGSSRAVTRGIEAMVEFYKKESGGKFDLKLAYGAALGPERQTPEAIKSGGYEGGLMCAGYYPNKMPLLSGMELPFLAPSKTEDRAKVDAAVYANPMIVSELRDRWNIKYFAPTFLPAYEFMGNKEIRNTADMKGVKMRISGLNAKALAVFGAVPTMVTAPEGYTALERGTIDSFGFPYSYTFGAYKLYEVSKYVTEGMAMSGFMCFIGVSQDAWDKLPKELQDKLPEAQKLASEALLKAYKEADDKWIPIFHEKLKVAKFSAEERAKLAAGANDLWEEWVKSQEDENRPGRAMLDFIKSEVAKYK